MSDLCRLCLSDSFNTISLTEYREGLSLSVLAMIILPVKIVENENLPQNICNDCLSTILRAYKLRDVSINSEKYLKSTIEEPEQEISIKSETFDYSSIFVASPEEQPNIQQEYQHPKKFKKSKNSTKTFKFAEDQSNLSPFEHFSPSQTEISPEIIDKVTIDCYKKDKMSNASMAWEYFGIICNENGRHMDVDHHYCTVCLGHKVLTKYRRTTSTSVLSIHLKIAHGIDREEIEAKKAQDPEIPKIQKKQRSRPSIGATVCSDCGKIFCNHSALKKHMRIHSGHFHTCDKCPAKFSFIENLQRHQRCHDLNHFSRHVCDMCGSSFAEFKSLMIHMKRVHLNIPPEKNHFCNFDGCSLSFPSAYNLKKHMLTHTDLKPHECQYCDSAYNSKGDLIKHLQKNHVGDAIYNCEFCPQSFRLKIQLRDHYRVHYESNEMDRNIDSVS